MKLNTFDDFKAIRYFAYFQIANFVLASLISILKGDFKLILAIFLLFVIPSLLISFISSKTSNVLIKYLSFVINSSGFLTYYLILPFVILACQLVLYFTFASLLPLLLLSVYKIWFSQYVLTLATIVFLELTIFQFALLFLNHWLGTLSFKFTNFYSRFLIFEPKHIKITEILLTKNMVKKVVFFLYIIVLCICNISIFENSFFKFDKSIFVAVLQSFVLFIAIDRFWTLRISDKFEVGAFWKNISLFRNSIINQLIQEQKLKE